MGAISTISLGGGCLSPRGFPKPPSKIEKPKKPPLVFQKVFAFSLPIERIFSRCRTPQLRCEHNGPTYPNRCMTFLWPHTCALVWYQPRDAVDAHAPEKCSSHDLSTLAHMLGHFNMAHLRAGRIGREGCEVTWEVRVGLGCIEHSPGSRQWAKISHWTLSMALCSKGTDMPILQMEKWRLLWQKPGTFLMIVLGFELNFLCLPDT